jgi:hypothetical protein
MCFGGGRREVITLMTITSPKMEDACNLAM